MIAIRFGMEMCMMDMGMMTMPMSLCVSANKPPKCKQPRSCFGAESGNAFRPF